MSNKRSREARIDRQKEVRARHVKTVQPRTYNQQTYLDAINDSKITFCIGPAGTGKTHLAIGAAVKALRHQLNGGENGIERIIISRPMISAARKDRGAIPGNPTEKMAPYIRPLMEELKYYCSYEELASWQTMMPKRLEVVALDDMRGLNFNNCFVILDEAQNAEEEQIELILTRLGEGSKMVLSGDLEQCDLPRRLRGGLQFFSSVLDGTPSISVVTLDDRDVQRDPIVATIIRKIRDARVAKANQGNQE
jgi:phosphate starvation-inducible protein PhoH and related proteins